MKNKVTIHDYITPIKRIVDEGHSEKPTQLYRLIYRARKINNRHLRQHSVDQTVGRLLEPAWRKRVNRFDPEEWRERAAFAWSRARELMGTAPPPELVLFPGFGSFNGRVYQLDRRPVIGCSPDFPRTTGNNLTVLLAHEYAHFLRWRTAGARCDNVPVRALIFEEGWAVWLSAQMLPEAKLGDLFMSSLHGAIGMPNPPGGYFRWCRGNLTTLVRESRKVLRSRDTRDLGRFFQCLRFENAQTPIRTGYYLGFRLIEMLSGWMTPRQLLAVRPTAKQMSAWLQELVDNGK